MIAANIEKIRQELPAGVKLIAISKTKPVEMIQEAYHAGQKIFGENKVQEMVAKHEVLPPDIEWHLVGHLQSNKVKYIAPFVHLIHAVDSIKLLETIDKEGAKNNRVINCLLQIFIAQEDTKFGLSPEEAEQLLQSTSYQHMRHVRICGLMGMATNTSDNTQVRAEFHSLKQLFSRFKSSYFAAQDHFSEISMGMSSDYKIAVEEGSTMIRVGSSIFGERSYAEQ